MGDEGTDKEVGGVGEGEIGRMGETEKDKMREYESETVLLRQGFGGFRNGVSVRLRNHRIAGQVASADSEPGIRA